MAKPYKTQLLWRIPLKLRKAVRDIRVAIRDVILAPETNYQLYLKYKYNVSKPQGYPEAPWRNAVLGTLEEWKDAVKQAETLGLPLHPDLPKNWDSLAALDCILKRTNLDAHILDAGAELYSVILPWLYLYGYKHLIGIDLIFDHPVKRGPIQYEYGNITHTRFDESTFDAITCLSVIEHGVNVHSYFQEVSRILKPNGVLITSIDYYPDSINTGGQMAFEVPIKIFSKDEVISVLKIAKEYGLELTDDINLDCQEKPVQWEQFNLDYTFLVFSLQKVILSDQPALCGTHHSSS